MGIAAVIWFGSHAFPGHRLWVRVVCAVLAIACFAGLVDDVARLFRRRPDKVQ